MYDYLSENASANIVGSFITDVNADFKNDVKSMLEGFRAHYNMDAVDDLVRILKVDAMKEDYKQRLLGNVVSEGINDQYYAMHPQKLEQLFENSALEIVRESTVGQLNPIVGISLPILKKNYIEGHAKDIVMTEVPSTPIIKAAFERKFMKDKQGNKYYIPEIFYDETYKTVVDKSTGKPVDATWHDVPLQDFDVLTASGGSIETRDSLAYDFCIDAVQIEITEADGTTKSLVTVDGLNIQPDFGANSSFVRRIPATNGDGSKVEDIISGLVDQYTGKTSVSVTSGKIKKVRFGGHLSNENNIETVELDRERETREWKIPDGQRINTGLTIEKIKDYKALMNIDITTEIIADMSNVLTQFEDSRTLSFLDNSFSKWKTKKDLPFGYSGGFVESYEFSVQPPSNVHVTPSQWIGTDMKFNLNREIDQLKVKLKETQVMFVVYGHPNVITLLQDDVKWVIDEDTKIGGIQLDYRFGVMTANKNRIHVVSSMKVPESKGFRIVAFPLTGEIITFKHYKYSMNIENIYRNPNTPLIPNIMATSRYLTTELLPVQGEFLLKDNDFGRKAL